MPLIYSATGDLRKPIQTPEELERTAGWVKGYFLTSLCTAGSGHSGGCLSAADLSTALYENVLRHDNENPKWENRDRVIWSTGHKAPLPYTLLAMNGYDILSKLPDDIRDDYMEIITNRDEFPGYDPIEVLMTLRKLYSPLEGHPNKLKLPGIEFSTGALGQGTSLAVGQALALRKKGIDSNIYVFSGDGELQEGQKWEANMNASHFGLGKIIDIVDKNRLQIDGYVKNVMDLGDLAEKYKAFGWNVHDINGHKMDEILDAFERAKKDNGKPTAIIANTVKGNGVSDMKDKAGWHGRAPKKDELYKAIKELGIEDEFTPDKIEHYLEIGKLFQKKVVEPRVLRQIPEVSASRKYFWTPSSEKEQKYYLFGNDDLMKVDMKPTRFGFGDALWKNNDERIIGIGNDISDSVKSSGIYIDPKTGKEDSERKKRFYSFGIQESSGATAASAFAEEGFLLVDANYSTFFNDPRISRMIAYNKSNVLFLLGHAGVSVGPDGPTHQALEDIPPILYVPNTCLVVPCDSIETEKATTTLLFDVDGFKAMRVAREATPIVTKEETPFVIGDGNVITYKGREAMFVDAFETVLGSKYTDYNNIDAVITTCGPMVPEAMRAAYILKEENGLNVTVFNLHTLKSPESNGNYLSENDMDTLLNLANESDVMITLEEHQKGGMGNAIAANLLENGVDISFKRMGVENKFLQSGAPWELTYIAGLSAEYAVKQIMDLYF